MNNNNNILIINPSSNIYLVHTNLLNDYKNTLTFKDIQAQTNYFTELERKSYQEYTYVQENNTIVVEGNIDNLRKYNYLYYTNSGSSTKTYYCFINKMEWLSDNSTRLYIETDVIQTYYFDIVYKKSFVEREHVADDTIGKHTIPENLETGDYKIQTYNQSNFSNNCCILLGTTASPIDGSDCTGLYAGVPSGCAYFAYDISTDGIAILRENLQYLTNEGKQSAVTGLFICPKSFVIYSESGKQIENTLNPFNTSLDIAPIEYIDEEEVVNNKLLTYPYCYYLITNGASNSQILKPELFINPTITNKLNIYGAVSPSMSIISVPKSYANEVNNDNYQYSFTLGKLPQLNYSTDQYINWLTENGVNNTIGALSGGLNALTSLANWNSSGVASGLMEVYNNIHATQMAERVPPTLQGNTNSGDVTFSKKQIEFKIYTMTIKNEYAKIIDNYFSYYGYKVNEFKIPQFTSRKYWNYIKTIDCNITGNIPQEFIEVIKGIFNKGLTFWHDTSKFLDYSQKNSILEDN